MAFIDLHSHVLPAIDDGAASELASRHMLGGLASLGFTTVVATPHQRAGQFLPTWTEITTAYELAQPLAIEAGLELGLGAENMWDDVFHGRLADLSFPLLNGGPAFLVEFPLGPKLPLGVLAQLFNLRVRGLLPVIAHPERYSELWRNDELVDKLGASCALVCDLGAVGGHHGRRQAKAARGWLAAGRIHAVASDVHAPSDIDAAAAGMTWIRKKLGDAELSRLLGDNPRRILAGELPT